MQYIGYLGVFLAAILLPGCADTGTDSALHDKQGSAWALAARIEVNVDRIALSSHGLAPADVHSALDQFFLARGVFSADNINNIPLARRVFSADDINNIPILRHGSGAPVKLGDVASVRVSLAAKEEYLRVKHTR